MDLVDQQNPEYLLRLLRHVVRLHRLGHQDQSDLENLADQSDQKQSMLHLADQKDLDHLLVRQDQLDLLGQQGQPMLK